MSTVTIPTRTDTMIIDQNWYNVIQDALSGDIVPRNSSGVPTDDIGNLGSTLYGFGALFLVGNGFKVKILAAPGMLGNYTVTLPSNAPPVQSVVMMNTAGNLICPPKLPVVSTSCGSFSRTATSFATVTNLSVPYVTVGGSVLISIQPDGTSAGSQFGFNSTNSGGGFGVIQILRNSTVIAVFTLENSVISFITQFGQISFFDSPAIGAYTYSVQAKCISSGDTISVTNCVLLVKEL